MPIPLLVLCPLAESQLESLSPAYAVAYAITPQTRRTAIEAQGGQFRAVLTNGGAGLTADEIAQLPVLELVASLGVGYEGIDVAAARARGVIVTHGRGANDECVADHAMGLVIACLREFRKLDRCTREGIWRTDISLPAHVSGKRLGILGMGAIGDKLAARAAAFRMPVGYHNRRPKADAPQRYFDSLPELAEWSDVLVCAAPGGAATHHLVDARVLRALGAQGYLINVGRGSVVDTEALAQALVEGVIAGAGIDVYESEPRPPAALIGLDNVLLSPHVAGWSPESVAAQFRIFMENLDGHFSGRGPVTPVP